MKGRGGQSETKLCLGSDHKHAQIGKRLCILGNCRTSALHYSQAGGPCNIEAHVKDIPILFDHDPKVYDVHIGKHTRI
jgi:hypothetical protein